MEEVPERHRKQKELEGAPHRQLKQKEVLSMTKNSSSLIASAAEANSGHQNHELPVNFKVHSDLARNFINPNQEISHVYGELFRG